MAIVEDEPIVGKTDARSDPLPPLPKLLRVEPIDTLKDVITTIDFNQTFTSYKKKGDSSTEQLLLTLIKEVKGLKEQIKPSSVNSPSVSQTRSSKSGNNKQSAKFRSIIIKRHEKTSYNIFRGRSLDISYFHVFGCPVFIHNHRDHLGKFDQKVDDGYFLRYSLVAKAFRVFNIKRQEIEETFHVTFNEEKPSLNSQGMMNLYLMYLPLIPFSTYNITVLDHNTTTPETISLSPDLPVTNDHHVLFDLDESKPIETHVNDNPVDQENTTIDVITNNKAKPSPTLISPSAKTNHDTPVPQDKWSRDKHILLVNILVIKALEDEGWAIALQEELNQFERNKGYIQEEGIYYDETFAPIARLEGIRKFLAYATYMGFMVYQMDVNSAFKNWKLTKEVYVQQPPRFKSSEFPNYVCKLDKYVKDLLKKYELADYALVKCLILPSNNLCPDESGVSVNETQFRGMISCKKNFQLGNLYKNDKLSTFNPHHITTASFNKTLSAYEVPLTSYLLQLEKHSPNEPEKTLLLYSREVNTDSAHDKSLSRTVV
ncbi:retrovirus-related pol polyprotein from transposon TNT 1-94 [Tanacetum coccineum]